MENQPPGERGGEDGSIGDRISQLPGPILDHVLSFLPQEDAVGTCILSKSWRHLGPTRPKIEFHESYFRGRGSKDKFLSVVENTLQRYADQNLSIQEFILGILWPDASNNSCTLLNKWIVKLQMLKRLSLHNVYIEDETFEKVMSSCPLIQHLFLNYCWGLSTIKLNKARNLKHFVYNYRDIDSVEINDDAPSLETIRISSCRKWFHLHNNCLFPRLKSLYLQYVHLPSTEELLNNLSSNNCPCLEEFQLHECYGFREFKLSNRSIKRLVINLSKPNPIEVAIIDAANMLCFEFRSHYYLPSISFATTSREWKSRIEVGRSSDSNATWSLKLYELLKALCQSQISLDISNFHNLTNQDSTYGGISEPVVVEHLYLWEYCPSSSLPALLNCVFRICRPRYIELSEVYSQLGESLLVNKEETRQCHFWKQDLEESSIQVSDKNPVQDIRFRLKWRDFY